MERTEIADRACELFTQISFVKTSVADIAAACGLGKGTIYLHFQTKDEILLTIIESRIERLIEENEEFFRDPFTPFQAKIERYFDSLVDEYFAIKDLMFGNFDNVRGTVLREVIRKCDRFYKKSIDYLYGFVRHDVSLENSTPNRLKADVTERMDLIVGRMFVFLIWNDWQDKEGLKAIIKPLAVKLFLTLLGRT
jgi:AcrR family transcriptional regulator